MDVKRISPEDTYILRNQILRPKGREDDYTFPGDHDEQTFHLGAFVDHKLVSITSFYFQEHPKIDQPHQYRLRGMATLASHRKQGLSKALIKTAIPIVKQNFCGVLWCNAREAAVGFYENIGFEAVGEFFTLPEIGQHLLMKYTIE